MVQTYFRRMSTQDPPAPATVPSVPLNVVVSPADGALDVTWNTPASDGGETIDGYDIRHRVTSPQGSYTTVSQAGAGTSYTIPGLLNGETYDVRVRAYNIVGDGPFSVIETGTPTAVSAPTMITSGRVNNNVALPAITDGDRIILCAGNLINNGTPGSNDMDLPAGYTSLLEFQGAAFCQDHLWCTKIASSDGGTIPDFGGNCRSVWYWIIRDGGSVTAGTGATAQNQTSLNLPSIDVGAAGGFHLVVQHASDDADSPNLPANYTQVGTTYQTFPNFHAGWAMDRQSGVSDPTGVIAMTAGGDGADMTISSVYVEPS